MSDLYAVTSRIAEATTVDQVWDEAVGYFRTLKFSRATYGFTRFRTEHTIGDPDDALFLSTYPQDYSRHYFQGGLYAKTAMYRWAAKNTGARSWRWVEEAAAAGDLTEPELEAIRVNRAAGVRAGMTISFPHHSPRSKGALGLAADQGMDHDQVDAIWAAKGREVVLMANMMHLKIMQLPLLTRRRPLTERQREVLEWVAEGKTSQDVAQIMNISLAMVEKHLRLARLALDVETTAQAVAKGTLLNRIFLNPPDPSQVVRQG